MKVKNRIILSLLFLAGMTVSLSGTEMKVLYQADFKNMTALHRDMGTVRKLKESGFPVGNLKNMVHPKWWWVSTLHNDLKLESVQNGWRIASGKTVQFDSGRISVEFSEFLCDVTLQSGSVSSAVSIGVLQSDMLNNWGVRPLRKVSLKAGETQTLHLPVRFELVNPGFCIHFAVDGDVTVRNFCIRGKPMDLADRGFTCVEGTVEACSVLPDPKKSDYPDCRFTCHFKGNSIAAGKTCPRDIQLIIEGFRNYRALESGKLKSGDRIRCVILPFESLTEERKSTQQADDLNLFQLESYYAAKIEVIKDFSRTDAVPFSDKVEHVSVFKRKINPPVSGKLEEMQRTVISEDLSKMNSMLAGWDEVKIRQTNAAFQKAWTAEKAKDKPGYNRIKGKYGILVWRNADHSFWCLPEEFRLIREYTPVHPENMKALTALRDFLHTHGCQFVVSLVPDLYDIAARVINPEFRAVPDFYTALTVQELLKNGIETVYGSGELIKNYNRYPWPFFFPHDGHPSDTCQDILSGLSAAKLKRFGFVRNLDPEKFSVIRYGHSYGKDVSYAYPDSCDIDGNQPGTVYQCRCVMYDGKMAGYDPASPVLVIGNSFIRTPMSGPDSFPTLLSMKANMGIASYRVSGQGPMFAIVNSLFNNPEQLKEKKVVIMQVGTYHLHTDVKFNNIREMDCNALLLSGRTLHSLIPVKSNTPEVPEFGKNLYHAEFFKIPASGRCSVLDCTVKNCDSDREKLLIVPVCVKEPCHVELAVNGQTFPVQECSLVYYWCKTFIRIPPDVNQIKIELKGKPGSIAAVGDIQLYQ